MIVINPQSKFYAAAEQPTGSAEQLETALQHEKQTVDHSSRLQI